MRERVVSGSLLEWLKKHVRGLNHHSNSEVSFDCPYCGAHSKYWLNLGLRGVGHCFRCQKASNWVGLMMKIERVDYETAKERTRSWIPYIPQTDRGDPTPEIPLPLTAVPAWSHPKGRAYLESRGVTEDQTLLYDIHYDPGTFVNHLILPVYRFGRLAGFQCRDLDPNSKHRYLSGAGSKLGDNLYGFDIARQYEEVVVVEGPFDVLRTGPFSVATFGKKVSPLQEQLLSQSTWKSVTVMYDSDALRQTLKFARRLEAFKPTFVALVPPDTDPGSLSATQLGDVLADRTPVDHVFAKAVRLGLQVGVR